MQLYLLKFNLSMLLNVLQKGVVCVWSVNNRGILTPMRQYRKKGEITALVFYMAIPKLLDVKLKGKIDPKLTNHSPSFFFGTERGTIAYADDLGNCTDVQQLQSSIDVLMFLEEKSKLVVITRSLLLTQYNVGDDGVIERSAHFKISVPSDIADCGIHSAVWASPGVLAIATEEKLVRFLDIAAEENFNISLNSALGKGIEKSDRISCIAFSPHDRYLAVGTQMNIVAIFKFNGPLRDFSTKVIPPSSSSDWQVGFAIYFISV